MLDFYARLELKSTATSSEVIDRLAKSALDVEALIRAILLSTLRRRAYDHAYDAMRKTASLRQKLSISCTEHWSLSDHYVWYTLQQSKVNDEVQGQAGRDSRSNERSRILRGEVKAMLVIFGLICLLIWLLYLSKRGYI